MTAPIVPVVPPVPPAEAPVDPTPAPTSWVPTRKWLATLVMGVLTIAGTALATHGWDNEEWGQLITLAIGLASAYLVPNSTDDK